jgi:hypothetical protein
LFVSVATSTLRAGILVAAAVLGVVVIRGAFPENASQGITGTPSPGTTTPSSNPSTSPTPSSSTTSRKALAHSKTVVLVVNGAGRTGLAGSVTDILKAEHYKAREPTNAARTNTTTLFYRADSEPEAIELQAFMVQRFGLQVAIEPAGGGFPTNIRLEVLLGKDMLTAPTPPP